MHSTQWRRLEAEDRNHTYSDDHSFAVGGDTHHAASLTLTPLMPVQECVHEHKAMSV